VVGFVVASDVVVVEAESVGVAALPESAEVEGKTNDVEGCFARTSLFLRKEKGFLAVFGDAVVELAAACSGCLGGSAGKFCLGAAAAEMGVVVVVGWLKKEKGLLVAAGSAGLLEPPNTLLAVVELASCEV